MKTALWKDNKFVRHVNRKSFQKAIINEFEQLRRDYDDIVKKVGEIENRLEKVEKKLEEQNGILMDTNESVIPQWWRKYSKFAQISKAFS